MTGPATAETPENWDAASRGYAERVAPLLMRPFSEPLVERLDLGADAEVVEVAAGSGALTEVLFPRVGSLLATDFSPQMIEVLRERLAALGATNVRCEVMDGQALEVEDSSFDAAACSFSLMLFPDCQKGFSELCRVLRPGGRVAVSGWGGPRQFVTFGFFLAATRAAFPDMPAPTSTPPVFRLADPVAFKSQMEAAGFRDVEVDLVSRDMVLPDFDTAWGMVTAATPAVRILLDRVGPAGKERVRDSLHEILDRTYGGGPMRMTNVATMGSGTAP